MTFRIVRFQLPSFMEEVNVAEIQLGNKPPIIQSISSPELDERGLWLDLDLTYDGLVEVTITTKLNLMRLKRQQMPNDSMLAQNLAAPPPTNTPSSASTSPSTNLRSSAVLYDSDAESSGSSSESESSSINNQLYMSYDVANASPANPEGTVLLNRVVADDKSGGGGGSKRFLRIVDRIAASNIFQSATELSYVQNAFKNMSTKIQLKLQLKSLMGRLVVNVPPTPSDRLWVAFRAPPKIELSAKPTLGSNVVDWTLVTNLIENKLYEEVCKYLVFPNMVDIIMPVLGESTYKE
jgi:cytoplasmic polyadenylation element-binding protein